jgi:hypothetical protein
VKFGQRECFKATITGKKYGVVWTGRLDIYVHTKPEYMIAGTVHNFFVTKVQKSVAHITEQKVSMRGYCYERKIRVPLGMPNSIETTETDTYAVILPHSENRLEPVNENPRLCEKIESGNRAQDNYTFESDIPKLVMGFGRQYSEAINLGESRWHFSVSGGCRSERYRTQATIAVVPRDSLPAINHVEHGQSESLPVD